jgi:hypothetical protein
LGASSDYLQAKTSGWCPEPAFALDRSATEQESARAQLQAFLSAHVKKMRRRAAQYGNYSFYARLETQPSNPWLFAEFNKIDLTQISKFRVLTQSICLRMLDGVLDEREMRRDETEFVIR